MKQAVHPQAVKTEEKKAEDKGFFVQLPCYLIDKYQDTLTSTAFVAFLRFVRKYSKKGNAEYKGSYRALAKVLNISHTSAIRVTDQWQEVELATKQEDEESDLLTITVSLAPIWEKNIEYSKGLDTCPNLGKVEQKVTTQPLSNGSVVTENSTRVTICDNLVTNIDTAVTICDNLVTFCSTFEHKKDPRYRDIIKILDRIKEKDTYCDCAIAPSPHIPASLGNYYLSKNDGETQLKPASNSYSQEQPPTDLQEKGEETVSSAVGVGYTTAEAPVNPPASPLSRRQKPEQAILLDDSSGYEKPSVQENKPTSKKKASQPKNEQPLAMIVPPGMPPEDAEWSPATIRGMFNFWRGHAPLTQGTAVQQNKAASALYQANYTREQITSVYEHMCQQSYWIERGGVEIWNVANCIARELKVINKIVPFQKPGKVDVYSLSYQASRPSRLPDMYIPELDDIPQEATN